MDWVDGYHKRDLLLGRVKNRHSVRMPKGIGLLVTPFVSFLQHIFESCLPIGFFYKESASHQFLSRVGPCAVRAS